jgi:hypothetical protein
VTPEAEERLTKAERFLSQAMGLSAEAAPEADGEAGRSFGRALNRAEDARLVSDYVYGTVPDASDASVAREAAIAFVAYCRSLL